MKTALFLPLVTLVSGCALAQPASLKFTVRVLDEETGRPVTNAIVQSFFEHQYDPWGNKANIIKKAKVPVDRNGEAVMQGKDLQGGVGGTAFAEGYYPGHSGQASEWKNLALNRWEPWNPIIEVKLRPKNNPVPMFYRKRNYSAFKVPEYNQPIGYDLEKQSFVAPMEKG
ncbi:hypothetical protein EGM51_17010 [Verrucomicrobia bacterium S94]|nr:hypothetical protein EGM51_17010 [Verrucomicrobia bacterium S94]